MSDYLSLEEAADRLGVSVNEFKEMHSRREVSGLKDGPNWKFRTTDIDRVKDDLSDDVLDDDPGGSSILASDRDLGASGSKSGSLLNNAFKSDNSDDDLLLLDDESDDDLTAQSDVALVPDPASLSGTRLVSKNAPLPADDDDEVLSLTDDDQSDDGLLLSDLNLEEISDGSDASDIGIDLSSIKSSSDSDVLAGMEPVGSASGGGDLITGDSDGQLQLDDEGSSLVLGDDSALSLKAESGINLNSPSDSGLSLEEPIDLSGASISGLGLSSGDIGSDIASSGGSGISGVGSASGLSGIDFAAAEDFQLSPAGGMEFDEDSGSQVIELEDSADFSSLPAEGMGGFDQADGLDMDEGEGMVGFDTDEAPAAYAPAAPDIEFSGWEVGLLLVVILFLGMAGILMTDTARNMWAATDGSPTNLNSWLSDTVAKSIGDSNN